MRYYLDTEFNGMGGALISLALVAEEGDRGIYLATSCPKPKPWIVANVLPVISAGKAPQMVGRTGFGRPLAEFLAYDPDATIVCNWPDDIRHFCQAMKQWPDMIWETQLLRFELVRVGCAHWLVPGAVRHNAWWDAVALRQAVLAANARCEVRAAWIRSLPHQAAGVKG